MSHDSMSIEADRPVPARRRRNTGRSILLVFLAIFVIAALSSVAFIANLAHTFNSQTQSIPQAFPQERFRPVKPTEGPAAQAQNILLLGSDSRGDGLNLAEAGDPSNQRSDTIMWLHVPADRHHLYLMSIMRDMWVDIPGVGPAKINAAMAYGGVPLVVQTLEGLFKTRIDHVAVIDFQGFKSVTDALGGVQVNVPLDFTSVHGNFTFKAGPQKLDGDQALAFVRERYAFVDGDYQRVKDQQLFLRAVLNEVMSPATMTNPFKVATLVKEISPYVSVDSTLNAATLGALALSLNGVRGSDVIAFTLPTLGTGTSADGQSIVLADDNALTAIGKALNNDTLGEYLQTAGLG
ncbi:LCP family protein required for cell wall assembly [Arthrobacter sp. UYCu511]|uniref:LCP family protein n=1 Tax=Arthrobacter sp. UYCu511 TaxID=3156337 RepID=UPI003396978D